MKRHPQAVALDKWLNSNEGQGCTDRNILWRREDVEFLENRLTLAFAAGWNAAMEQKKVRKR